MFEDRRCLRVTTDSLADANRLTFFDGELKSVWGFEDEDDSATQGEGADLVALAQDLAVQEAVIRPIDYLLMAPPVHPVRP